MVNSFKEANAHIFECLCEAHCYITSFLHKLNDDDYFPVKPIYSKNGDDYIVGILINDKNDLIGIYKEGGSVKLLVEEHPLEIMEIVKFMEDCEKIFA